MPFLTEEIWQRIAPLAGKPLEDHPSIMLEPFPSVDESRVNPEATAEMEWVKGFILGIRSIRGEMDIPPGKPLTVLIQDASEYDLKLLQSHRTTLDTLARLDSIEQLAAGVEPPQSATALAGEMKILIPMAGLIDKEAESKRLQKELEKSAAEILRLSQKLENPQFVERAPDQVVQRERDRLCDVENRQQQLQQQLDKIAAL